MLFRVEVITARRLEILRGQEFELGEKRAVTFRGTSILFTLDQHFPSGSSVPVRFDSFLSF